MIINHFFLQIKLEKRIESYIFVEQIREMIFLTFIYTALDGIRRSLYGECYRLL